MGSAASVASSLFTDFPFSGEVNFLTTGSVAPGALLSATALPRGVAYLALARAGAGRRLVDPRRDEPGRSVVVDRGRRLRFERQAARTATTSVSRTAPRSISVAIPPRWRRSGTAAGTSASCTRFDRVGSQPDVTVEYGARYAHYDYLQQRGLLSPKFGVAVEAFPRNDRPRRDRAAHGRAGRRGIPDHQRSRSLAPARAHVRAAWRGRGPARRARRASSISVSIEQTRRCTSSSASAASTSRSTISS